jgi:hypothetical protein
MFGIATRKRWPSDLVKDQFGNPVPASVQQPLSGLIGSQSRMGRTPDNSLIPGATTSPTMGMDSIVATPEQQAQTRAFEQQFPSASLPMDQRDAPQRQPAQQAMLQSRMQQPQLPDSSNQPRQIDPDVMKLIGDEPARAKSFWQGGKKFGVTDGIAGILAVLGDGLSRNRGYGDGGAVQNLIGGRTGGLSALKEAQAAYQRNQQVAGLPGMNAREFAAFQADPKAWGSNMSRASTSRYDSVTANPGDVRMYGDGGGYWQAPTRGQQYAGSLGLEQGTDAYNGALRDQELGANGPTAFSNQQSLQAAREAQARYMEQMRQQGRMGIEGLRQTNRSNLRGAPTYRDLNPAAPRSGTRSAPRRQANRPTATGADGRTIYYDGKAWVDAQGRPVQ